MAKYRVRATSTQTYTQFFTIEANSEREAIERVKNGGAPLTYERFEEVDDFTPTHAYRAEDNADLMSPAAPPHAHVITRDEPQLARVA